MERLSWYVLRRLLVLAIGVLVILTAEFCLFRVLPDDLSMSAFHRPFNPSEAPDEYVDWVEQAVRMFDQPLYVQYFEFIGDMLTGDFGFSTVSRSEVSENIYSAMWNTFILFGASLSLCLVIGSLAGRAMSRIKTYLTKQALSIASLALFSLPVVAWQWLLSRYISNEWGLLPAWGASDLGSSGVDLEHLILPLASIFLASIGAFILCIRDGHTRASAALSPKHLTLRDSLFAAMPSMQFMVAASLLFVVSAEWWFNYPGLGWYFLSALYNMDFFWMQASFFLLAIMVFAVNFAMETVVTLMRPERRLDLCLREDDDRPVAAAETSVRTDQSSSLFSGIGGALVRVAKDYLRSPVGVVSLAVFVAIVVLAVVGPWFSSDEITSLGLGFDSEPSIDLFLDGATAPVVISISVGLIALFAGMALGIVAGYSRPYADGVIVAIMQGLISIPCIGLIVLLWAIRPPGFGYLEEILACSVPIMALVTLVSFRGFISSRNQVAAASRGGSKRIKFICSVPAAASSALSGLKYGMPMTVITVLLCDFWGLTSFSSWGHAFGVAASSSVYGPIEWDYILAPLIGSALLIGSIFLVLDTIERVIRTRFSELV